MHIAEAAGELHFVLDASDVIEDKDFYERMKKYKLLRQGASLFIYSKSDGTLLSHYNPFDNTQLICSPDGFSLANEFGAKRFLVLKARTALTEALSTQTTPENFPRDRSFPLRVSYDVNNPYGIVTLEKLLEINQGNPHKLYDELADLFDRCADFIPEKQAEYQSGGKKQDKFCRFNLESQQARDGIITQQIFLVDQTNKVIGTISATVSTSPDGIVDVYLYDEVVDYFTQIAPHSETMKQLQALYEDKKLSPDNKKTEIAKIIEPLRLKLMAPLFTAVRQQLSQTIRAQLSTLTDSEVSQKLDNGSIRAFIRAADKRVSSYEQLGCGTHNEGYYVIHGKPTPAAKLVDAYVKEAWAQNNLNQLARASLRNPMQANTLALVGVNLDLEVSDEGKVKLALDVVGTKASAVINELESTHFVNLEELPDQARARERIYEALIKKLDSENGKHYLAIDPAFSGELLNYINKLKPDYTDNLVKKTNLLFAYPEQAKKFKNLPTDQYKFDVLKSIESNDDLEHCTTIAQFQKASLLAMRPSLTDAVVLKKMDERYSEEALIKKAQSGKIIVLSATTGKGIIATLVLNLHATHDKSSLDNTVYLSDLIIEKDFIDDEEFVMQFMASALQTIAQELPSTRRVTFMAPGNASDPLVRCIEKAKAKGLFSTLDQDKQAELGLVAYFVQEPQNKPILNLANTPANLFHYRKPASSSASSAALKEQTTMTL